jgi:polysaccharide biosynthesis protein PslJ
VASVELTPPQRSEPLASSRATLALVSWPAAISTLVLLIWLVPIKRYTLPVDLPFRLEVYRLGLLALLVTFGIAVIAGRARLSLAGAGAPVLLLTTAALASQVANQDVINAAGLQTQSLKSLSFFLGYLVVFALVTSTLRSLDEIHTVLAALAIGAAIVAVAALVEGRTRTNLFDGLHEWIPLLRDTGEDRFNYRGGRLRVRASAQHPIALACALLLVAPVAVYLARHARSRARTFLWLGAALVMMMAALATVSRTAVLMLGAFFVVVCVFRASSLRRYWPLLAILVVATHFTAPGAMRHLYKAYTPKGGLVQEQQARSAQQGSGRIADIGPGVRRWSEKPLVGRGLGTSATLAEPLSLEGLESLEEGAPLRVIYDNQYLHTLVALGALGFIGILWFVWGAVLKLGRAARRTVGREADLMVACTASCAAFGASLAVFDAFSFVQATLVFVLVAALGLRARALLET